MATHELFASAEEAQDTLRNLLVVVNEKVKPRQRMTNADIGKLVQGGPQELESELAHEIGNVMITAVYLGDKILP